MKSPSRKSSPAKGSTKIVEEPKESKEQVVKPDVEMKDEESEEAPTRRKRRTNKVAEDSEE